MDDGASLPGFCAANTARAAPPKTQTGRAPRSPAKRGQGSARCDIDAHRPHRQDAPRMAFIFDTVRDLGRLREIAAVLARHGFGEFVQRTGLGGFVTGRRADSVETTLAERVRRVLEDLGPSFVKLGQLLSTRADLLPSDIIAELK